MNILNRYIITQVIKYFLVALISVLCIFVTIEYLEKMDEFIEAEISLWRGLQYVLYKAPFVTAQSMPVILLMAILIVFGLMSKHNELIIINASGISIYSLVKPAMLISASAALLLFYLSEYVVPVSMQHSNTIKYQEIRKNTNISIKKENLWIKGPHRITHIKYFDPAQKAIFGLTRYYFGKDFRLVRRIDARKGEYKQDKWVLHDSMDQKLNPTTNTYDITFKEQLKEDLQLHPDDFKQIIKKSEEMNFKELMKYIEKVESEGYDATAYWVDLYAKSAYPFVCIIMGLVGLGLTAKKRLNTGLPISITLGICIGFLYWAFQSFCISLGYGHVLPPLIAAWAANFIFFCGAGVLILNIE